LRSSTFSDPPTEILADPREGIYPRRNRSANPRQPLFTAWGALQAAGFMAEHADVPRNAERWDEHEVLEVPCRMPASLAPGWRLKIDDRLAAQRISPASGRVKP